MSAPDRFGLVERERELAELSGLVEAAAAGSGGAVVVEGPAGIGKTRLLDELGRATDATDVAVLRARGSEFETEMAFGVARQLFEPMLREASPARRRQLLDGVARVGAHALGLEPGEPPADQFAAIHGLFWLCANRAERYPLVVLVDDVQWADDPSLAWLGYTARRASDLPLLVVVGLRSGDPSSERTALMRLTGEAARRIVLGPLSAAGVGQLVRAELGEDAEDPFCAAVGELTGGTPLLVCELLAAARQEGLSARAESVSALRLIAPAAVATSVLARLARLGADAVALARAVAVLGPGAEVQVAAQLAELDPVAAELSADRLAAAQILASARPLEFFHPVIGAAVRDDIAPGARRLAHRRAARLIDRHGEESLARVAAHLLDCGPAEDRWVVERLGAAAREALDHGAPEIAVDYARRALAEPPEARARPELLLLLGTAEWRAGHAQAIAHLEQALAEAEEDPRTWFAACTLLALAHTVSDRADRAVDVLERAVAAVSDTPDLALTGAAATAVAGLMDERTAQDALRRADALHAQLKRLADPPVLLLVTLAYHAARANRADEAQKLAERALGCEPYPPPLDLCPTLIVALILVERYHEALRLCEDLLALARRRGALQETVAILAFRAWALCDRGALADAEVDARWALERAQGVNKMHAATELVRVLIERDELAAAEEVLTPYADAIASCSIRAARLLFARGRLRDAQGRPQDALNDFLECGERCARLGLLTPSALPWRREAALLHATLGHTDQARQLTYEQFELSRTFGRPRTLGLSLRACGLIEGGERGLELLHDAVTTLERSQSPLEHARALADHGAALRRAGQRTQARAALEQALDLAHRCGARRIANHARAELIAAGAKPRRDAITGRDALTASELRVARLAADGLSNREIAQALFITTKTAKAHLNRVYRKLEMTRRGQLAGALADLTDEDRDSESDTPANIS